MSISLETIESIAHLARLKVASVEDGQVLQADLTRIVGMVNQITAIDTTGVEPIAHPLEVSQRFREDAVTEVNQRDELLALAPSAAEGLFLVPSVL